MPIYDYQCQKCNFRDDLLLKVADAIMQTCPECKQQTFKKLVSAPAFKLNGSGWYETDFKNSSKEQKNKESNSPKEKEQLNKSEKKNV